MRGEYYPQFTTVYPLLLALYGLFDSPTAFKLAHILKQR